MPRRRLAAPAVVAVAVAALVVLAAVAVPMVRHIWAGADRPHGDALPDRQGRPWARPLVIAHRGASAYAPEHTIEAYKLAIDMGAEYIEADLVPTEDGVLVARHESELSATTDVARHPDFAPRRTTKKINGATVTGWFTEDFTVAELRTLRAVPRGRPGEAVRRSTIPTLDEIIALTRNADFTNRREVGVYLELKSPAYFASIGLAMEQRLADALRRHGLARPDAAVFVESFEEASLRTVHRLVDVPLVQLLWGAGHPHDPATHPTALDSMAQYASVLGVDRARLTADAFVRAAQAGAGHDTPGRDRPAGTTLVGQAHRRGLDVHVYTFDDNGVKPPLPRAMYRPGDPAPIAHALAEYRMYYALGIDGVFSDNPDTAVRARR